MAIPQSDIDKIEFERVHRIPTRPNTEKKPNPRLIIAKVSLIKTRSLSRPTLKT